MKKWNLTVFLLLLSCLAAVRSDVIIGTGASSLSFPAGTHVANPSPATGPDHIPDGSTITGVSSAGSGYTQFDFLKPGGGTSSAAFQGFTGFMSLGSGPSTTLGPMAMDKVGVNEQTGLTMNSGKTWIIYNPETGNFGGYSGYGLSPGEEQFLAHELTFIMEHGRTMSYTDRRDEEDARNYGSMQSSVQSTDNRAAFIEAPPTTEVPVVGDLGGAVDEIM